MEAMSKSAGQEPLPRPHRGPYSESWTSSFDAALDQVLVRQAKTKPPDVQVSEAQLRTALRSQRDVLASTTGRQIDRIDRLVEELHDHLVAVLARNPGELEPLADAVRAGDILLTYRRAASTDPAAIPTLVAYADTVKKWLSEPGHKLPLEPTVPPDSRYTGSFDGADMFASLVVEGLYGLQTSLLQGAQERARNDRAFRAKEEQLGSLRRDLGAEFESMLAREANKELNNARKAADQSTMTVPSVDELRESLTNEKPVITAAFRSLDRMIGDRREGSIGISGPRGVGKSTMIEFFAAGGTLPDEPENSERPRLGVLVSAPVVYDAREFVLYLYAEICRKIAGDRAVEADWAKPMMPHPPSWARFAWIPTACLASLIFATGLFISAVRSRVTAGGEIWADVGLGALVAGLVTLAWLMGRAYRSANHPRWQEAGTTVVPAGGLVLFLSNGAWGTAWPYALGGVALFAVFVLLLMISGGWLRRVQPLSSGGTPPQDPLVEQALERLREIRIQQSNTTERSIMLKVSGAPLPLGVDAGGKSGVTWQHRPKGYPELVGDLRAFLTSVQERYKLVIGIDELDKMAKAEKVEDFLNDVKAIFGVKGCFFLVSVSEDAAAGFERRGVPFRDVFDSSFDDVISVPYLDFATARELLYGLIIGWTQPFVALCYVLSGGLARDLVRSTRELVGYRDEKDRIELAAAALGMCRREAGARLRAVRHELMKDSNALHSAALLNVIAEYSPDDATADVFQRWAGELRRWAEDAKVAEARAVVRLATELAAFMLFVTTVLQFFDPGTIAQRLKDNGRARSLANLASARQTITMGPMMSVNGLTRFRAAWGLT